MKNYWVTFANTNFDARRLNVEKLPYPLSMHVPGLAFSNDNIVKVSAKTKKFEIGVELAFRIGEDIFQQSKEDAQRVVETCHLAVSVTNSYHIDGIRSRVVTPSDQDEADSEYYTRWWEGSNSISEKLDCSWEGLIGKEVTMEGDGFHQSGKTDYFHSPADIVHFISNINKLYKGTYICLGHILRQELEVGKSDGMRVKAVIPSIYEHQVELKVID